MVVDSNHYMRNLDSSEAIMTVSCCVSSFLYYRSIIVVLWDYQRKNSSTWWVWVDEFIFNISIEPNMFFPGHELSLIKYKGACLCHILKERLRLKCTNTALSANQNHRLCPRSTLSWIRLVNSNCPRRSLTNLADYAK